ncbi:hypothetical protein G9A89_019637 [Geosiphon pyriformis]|nr:hypothetical protein G9A89_019637 [Geosiphon pyriformis]
MGGPKGGKGELRVCVVEARELTDKDIVGKSDPYVELWIDEKYKQRTTTKDNTLNPIWNETFHFNIPNHKKHILHIRVLDSDVATSDDTIGTAKVDLQDVFQRGQVDRWVKLPGMFGLSSHGEVHLAMNFTPTN